MKQVFSRSIVRNLIKNQASNIKLDHLTKLCEVYNYTRNDLMYDDWANVEFGSSHELKKLSKDRFVNKEIIKNLPLDELQELQAYVHKLKEG